MTFHSVKFDMVAPPCWSIMERRRVKGYGVVLSGYYTPKHASWLNQAEIEIGLYQRMCIGKDRIGEIEDLKERTGAWNQRMNRKKVKIIKDLINIPTSRPAKKTETADISLLISGNIYEFLKLEIHNRKGSKEVQL